MFVALEETEWREVYPMDFYKKGGGPWTNYYEDPNDKAAKDAQRKVGGKVGGNTRAIAGN